MNVVLLTADLMTQSRVEAAATRSAVSLRSVSDPTGLATSVAELLASAVILDLTLPTLDVAASVAQLRSLPGVKPVIIAFGPHVHESLLAAAQEAGCDEVLSRGQFFAQLDSILGRSFAAPQ
jgi:CheY-like chemotaxis protein